MDGEALEGGDGDPDEEAAVGERLARFELLVEFRVEVCEVLVYVAVEHEAEDGELGVHGYVADDEPVAEEGVGLEVGGDAEDGLRDGDDEAAVDDELAEFGAAFVRVAAVPDEQFGQVVELGDAEVGGERGLSAFFADDADADVCGLDHGDVVAAVADTGYAFLCVFADEEGDVGFLGRGTAAGNYSGEENCEGDKGLAVVEKEVGEGVAVN